MVQLKMFTWAGLPAIELEINKWFTEGEWVRQMHDMKVTTIVKGNVTSFVYNILYSNIKTEW